MKTSDNEVKTLLKRMAFCYLLLAINVIPCAGVLPDVFPFRNSSTVYLLALSVCLVLYYAYRVTPAGTLSFTMKAISWTGLLLILLRGIKYSVFAEVGVLARHAWYLYYVPLLLLPLFLFHISLLVSPEESARAALIRRVTLAVTGVLIALVLTNDFHQLVFAFAPDFADWDSAYAHGWLFYAVILWQYVLYLAAIVILVVKCRIGSAKKLAWLILIPFAIGAAMSILLIANRMPQINGTNVAEYPETLLFTVAIVLECCMQLGLIPTNTHYGSIFRNLSIAAQITDKEGTPVYVSQGAVPLTREQFALESGSRIVEHTILHRMEIPGGFGFWQDDMTELDRLNAELAEAKEELAHEAELIRMRGELKERETKIEQRSLVYDTIAARTQKQSQDIRRLAEEARLSADSAFRKQCRDRILQLAAYIKRYANLMLLAADSKAVEAGELGLSIAEVLRYLNFCGIPGECIVDAETYLPADAAIAVFEAFEELLEGGIPRLAGVFVNVSGQKSATIKMMLEGLCGPLPQGMAERLLQAGVHSGSTVEDNTLYVSFSLPEGGEAA